MARVKSHRFFNVLIFTVFSLFCFQVQSQQTGAEQNSNITPEKKKSPGQTSEQREESQDEMKNREQKPKENKNREEKPDTSQDQASNQTKTEKQKEEQKPEKNENQEEKPDTSQDQASNQTKTEKQKEEQKPKKNENREEKPDTSQDQASNQTETEEQKEEQKPKKNENREEKPDTARNQASNQTETEEQKEEQKPKKNENREEKPDTARNQASNQTKTEKQKEEQKPKENKNREEKPDTARNQASNQTETEEQKEEQKPEKNENQEEKPDTSQDQASNQTKTEKQKEEQKTEKNENQEEKPKKTSLEYPAQKIHGEIKHKNNNNQPEAGKNQKPKIQKEQEAKTEKPGSPIEVGHRSSSKPLHFQSSVPVTVLNSSELSAFGNTVDLTDQLNTLVPSYTASPAVNRSSAFVRPVSLRGMASDQTLVLINGKRRHRSALVQEFGPLPLRGSQGIDISMIPSIALENVEILRGGASAQYGSSAMAGVINFNLRSSPEKSTIQGTYGRFYEGENSWRFGANLGFSFFEGHGFANFSFDTNEAQGHSRGEQDTRVTSSFPTNHGRRRNRVVAFSSQKNESVETLSLGHDAVFGDSPLVNSWGRPETDSTRLMINSVLKLVPKMDLYFFGNYAVSDRRTRLLYRDPKDPAFSGNSRWAENLEEISKVGFTPYLDGEQEDLGLFLGLRGDFYGNTTYDLSTNFGYNTLNQRLRNSLNPDAYLYYGSSQRNFYLGGYKQLEQGYQVDFSTLVNEETKTNVSYGLEYREELFGQYAGSISSFYGAGPSGMTGISYSQEGEYTRENYSAYIDLEHEFKKSILLQYSFRYDQFSDIGDNTNHKVSGLINLTSDFAMRGSLSTNFRAPTLGQSHLMSKIIGQSNLESVDHKESQYSTLNFASDSDPATELGGTALRAETSRDVSLGFMLKMDNQHFISLDGYNVKVRDRIFKTSFDQGAYEERISFFSNAFDIEHNGFDLVWTSDFSENVSFGNLTLNLSYNYNTVRIAENKFIGGFKALSGEQVEDFENYFPKHNFVLTVNTMIKRWGLMARARYIGDHYDQLGLIDKKKQENRNNRDLKSSLSIDPLVYFDLEISFNPTKDFSFVLGGANIFDQYPNKTTRSFANLLDYGMPYPLQSVAGYEGGSWYLRMNYNF